MSRVSLEPVLILGAGINGAAIAREFALNGIPVVIVDTGDIAGGTTAYSSRLIHGGLRYLEYGEFDLVRESLTERTRLLQHAPHLVRPLELFIPVRHWWRGLWDAARTFFGWPAKKRSGVPRYRGLAPIRMGLWLYDKYAQDPTLPKSRVHRVTSSAAVAVDSNKFVRECSYYDAQVEYAERLAVELLVDAAAAAQERGVEFQVLTYHRAELAGVTVTIHNVRDEAAPPKRIFRPSAIINATGAWVDRTLDRLHVPSPRLIGGTRGSHLLTHQRALCDKLAGRALYVEAPDGRPVFILPFGDGVLVGTTDDPFDDPPESAVATADELSYLLAAANDVLPDVQLKRSDIDLHYCGVRPLPFVESRQTAGITRRHWLHEHTPSSVPLFSVIGGKLTTCRSLAEETATLVLGKLNRPPITTSRERALPGGLGYPAAENLAETWRQIAWRFELRGEQVRALWKLFGMQTSAVLTELVQDAARTKSPWENLPGTDLPRGIVGWCVRHEWAVTLDDIVERRLMLLFQPRLSPATLSAVAAELVTTGVLSADQAADAVAATIIRLESHFGRQVG